jgi:hypothetical protein
MKVKWPRRGKFESAWKKCQRVKGTDLFPNNEPGFVSKGQLEDIREAQGKIIQALMNLKPAVES